MNELRYERERQGWSLDDIANRTRIPRTYLEALENGDHEVLPPGPFFRGYLRQYLEFLGADDTERTEAEQSALDTQIEGSVALATSAAMATSQHIPLVRLVITGFVITIAIVLIQQVGHRIATQGTVGPDGTPLPAGPPHHLNIYAIDDVRLTVHADDEPPVKHTLRGTRSLSVDARHRLGIDISDLGRVSLTYNKEHIEPLGSVNRKRRLVFMHEVRD